MRSRKFIWIILCVMITALFNASLFVYADEPQNVVEIKVGKAVKGVLNENGVENWYKINAGAAEYSDIMIKNGHGLRTNAYVYESDSEGKPKDNYCDTVYIGANGENSITDVRGTVYLKIAKNDGGGSYTLSLSTKKLNKGLNNSSNTATAITAGGVVEDIIAVNDMENWYKVNAGVVEYSDIVIKNRQGLRTNAYVYESDSEGKPKDNYCDTVYIGANGENSITDVRGTVYLKVAKNDGRGSYTLNLSTKKLNKGLNNSSSTATVIAAGGLAEDIIAVNDVENWYKVNTGTNGPSDITIKNGQGLRTNAYVYECNSEGKPKDSYSESIYIGANCEVSIATVKGPVYIKVAKNEGRGSYIIGTIGETGTAVDAAATDSTVPKVEQVKPEITVDFENKENKLGVGESIVFKPIVKAATPYKELTWYSSDETILKVDQSGNVTGLSEGVAFVLATTDMGGNIGIRKVNVIGKNGAQAGEPVAKDTAAEADKLEYTLETSNGIYKGVYSGNTAGGVPQGEGFFVSTEDTLGKIFSFYGQWDNGKIHGQGIAIFPDGSRLVGSFDNNLPDGYGIEFYASGKERYKGNFLEGNRNGYGVYTWENGTKYEGQFEKAKLTDGSFVLSENDRLATDNKLTSINTANLKSVFGSDDSLKGKVKSFFEGKVIDYIEDSSKIKYINIGWTLTSNIINSDDPETAIASTIVDVLMPPWVGLAFGDSPRMAAIEATKEVVVGVGKVGEEVLTAIPKVAGEIAGMAVDIGTSVTREAARGLANIATDASGVLTDIGADILDAATDAGANLLDSTIDVGGDIIEGIFGGFFR